MQHKLFSKNYQEIKEPFVHCIEEELEVTPDDDPEIDEVLRVAITYIIELVIEGYNMPVGS